jgi:hypothetical protein
MGLIGDLLYPDNEDMARRLNKEQQTLVDTNALHNDLVNAYRALAEDIGKFDAYLMALLVMQYHLAYTQEDLQNLPATSMPKLTESLADKIEQVALDALSIKMGLSGLKAIGQRIANVVREGGSYSGSIARGGEAVAEDLQPELDIVSTQADLLRSGNIDLLTETDVTAPELGDLAGELQAAAEDLGEVMESGEIVGEGGGLAETADSVAAGVEAAAEISEAAAEAAAAAAEAGAEAAAAGAGAGAASILGPAAVIIIVVTEIIAAIDAAETHEKLEKALDQMRTLQTQSDKSLKSLRKAFKSLLTSAKVDIQTYNGILKRLFQLEKNPFYDKAFDVAGLESFIQGVDALTVETSSSLSGYLAAATDELGPAIDFIRDQARHDASMTEVISTMKTHLRAGNIIDDDYLRKVAEVESVDLDRVRKFNTFRRYIAEFASVLKPFHEQVRRETPPNAKGPASPRDPDFGKPDPDFDPHPDDFTIPGVEGKKLQAA